MRNYDDVIIDDQRFLIGNQPRKSTPRKIKKEGVLKKFEREVDEFGHHRNTYKRAADKNFTRALLRADQLTLN